MHRIGVVGLSHRHADLDEIARFAIPRSEIAARLPLLRAQLKAAELLYIGTCNRVELVYATEGDVPADDARQIVFRLLAGREAESGEAARRLRAWTGEAAVEHLFMLACGLDSAQTGEQEIAAQLRTAWQDARAAHTSGALLDRLIGEALRMARRAQQRTAAARPGSLADLAVERLMQHIAAASAPGAPAERSSGTPTAPVALVGVSAMTRKCAALLREANIPLLIVNRSFGPAEELAASIAARPLLLEDFRARPPALSALVLATGSAGVLLGRGELERLRHAAHVCPLIVDFGVPPNIDPADARHAALPRVGMDELIETARAGRPAQLMRLAPVRAAIDERLAQLRNELALRAIGPRLAQLRGEFERIAAEEVSRALARGLRTLDDRQRAQLERLARSLAHRLAHLPLAGLKAAAVHVNPDAVAAFFAAARSERARQSGAGNG